ncbi:voltage-gated potassium channel protein [Acidithiobacillus sp. IBUN Pt1247-S3]|uniref:voltage-gated potassium channel protein n=1 Tax=Acidithiobacillus sp. IBUN Pt1247-S3 TaxID=3166642 RepID=UPI0034E4B245
MMRATELFHFSPWQRVRRWGTRVRAVLRLDRWFPQIPLALAVAGLGAISVLQALPALQSLIPQLAVITPSRTLTELPVMSDLGAIPALVIGVILLIMALGLVFRSRLSWALTLIISAISLALLLHRFQHLSVAMLIFNGMILVGLLVFRRHFSRSSVAAGTLFASLSIILLMSYAVFGSYVLGAGFSPQIKSLESALYFAVVTMSTVGYGDIVPKSPEARYFVISIIILGITVFATSISAVVVPLINGRMQRLLLGEKRSDWSDHYVLIGDNLFAQNTYRALRRRHLRVLVVARARPEPLWLPEEDLFVGDPTDPAVLRRAGAMRALGVLALRNDDSENAFIVLTAKEMAVPGKTVALVGNQRHLQRLRQTGVDLVIAPEVLGGQLLVESLMGEGFQGDAMLDTIFSTGAKA